MDRSLPLDHKIVTALGVTLAPHLGLGKSRLETLCMLIVGMVSARTVNLTHLAAERPGQVLLASTYRRLQRFFQYVSLPGDAVARLVLTLVGAHLGGLDDGKSGAWYLCLDRTNWKIGTRHVPGMSMCWCWLSRPSAFGCRCCGPFWTGPVTAIRPSGLP